MNKETKQKVISLQIGFIDTYYNIDTVEMRKIILKLKGIHNTIKNGTTYRNRSGTCNSFQIK